MRKNILTGYLKSVIENHTKKNLVTLNFMMHVVHCIPMNNFIVWKQEFVWSLEPLLHFVTSAKYK